LIVSLKIRCHGLYLLNACDEILSKKENYV
ncbi:MAG: hypothetical protein ACI9VO_000966, partial [Colwellia sp.]